MVNFSFVALPHDPVSIVTISMSWRNKLEPGTDWNNVVNFSDHLAYSEAIGNIQLAWFWIVGSTHETWRPPFEQMTFLYVKLKTQLGYCRLNTATLKILRMFITTVWATIWNEWTWKTNVTHKLQIIVKLPYRALHIEAWKKEWMYSRIPNLIYRASIVIRHNYPFWLIGQLCHDYWIVTKWNNVATQSICTE